ncbi:MAG: heavy metal translocating P-type ATPase, partial [bacterium]
MMEKQEIVLQGLNCANCAQKIEAGVQKMPEIKSASLNLVKQILSIELGKEADNAQILAKIEKIVHELEPEVKVFFKTEEKDATEEFSMAGLYWKLGIGVFLWLTALFLPDSLKTVFYLLSYLVIGSDVLLTAGRSIIKGQVFNEYLLMSIATIGAIAINEFNEGIAVMLFYQIGEGFQRKAVNHSRKSITALLKLKPEKAHLKTGDGLLTVEPEKVKAGDIIIVKPGEKVPLDGVIVKGMSYVDTSALTGESVPRKVEEGSEVLSGFINTQGMLTVEVKREFSNSAMMKVLDLVQNAASRKSPIENFITAFARYYTPAVVIAALGLACIPPLVLQADFTDWVYRALVFLVVSCPCALVLSIPLGFFGGIGGAAKQGILVKGGNYLDALNKVDAVVLDKTGTLTKGVFKVNKVYSADGFTDDEVLQYAASAESFSNHPIALSIVEACTSELKKEEVSDFRELAGYGVKAKYGTRYLLLGNEKLLRREGISFTPC